MPATHRAVGTVGTVGTVGKKIIETVQGREAPRLVSVLRRAQRLDGQPWRAEEAASKDRECPQDAHKVRYRRFRARYPCSSHQWQNGHLPVPCLGRYVGIKYAHVGVLRDRYAGGFVGPGSREHVYFLPQVGETHNLVQYEGFGDEREAPDEHSDVHTIAA